MSKKTVKHFPISNVKIFKCSECILDACKMFLPDDPPCRDCGKPWYFCCCCEDCWRLTSVRVLEEIASIGSFREFQSIMTDCIQRQVNGRSISLESEDFDAMVDRVMSA